MVRQKNSRMVSERKMASKLSGNSDPAHIPSLDGIRAVAISSVILSHIGGRYHWPLGWPDAVGVFFVLSGFLITTLLLREYDRKNTISLKRFYIRRCFRILPPFYTYIFFLLIFCLIEHIAIPHVAFINAALFMRDYSTSQDFWATGHLWSLGVEEQFYILWPALLILGLKRGGRRTAAKIALACIVLAPALRIGGKLAHIGYFAHRVPQMFHCRMDALMCGCLVAILTGTPRFENFFAKISKFWWIWLAYTFVITPFLIYRFAWGEYFWMSIGLTLDAISASLLILWLARNSNSLLGRFLNTRLLTTMGVLSYSAYLWQTFFIHPANSSLLGRMPFATVWIWIAAWLSYRLIERPALQLRNRVLRREKGVVAAQSVEA